MLGLMQDRHTGNEQLDLEYATLQHTVSGGEITSTLSTDTTHIIELPVKLALRM